jgi:hypothetical protein
MLDFEKLAMVTPDGFTHTHRILQNCRTLQMEVDSHNDIQVLIWHIQRL